MNTTAAKKQNPGPFSRGPWQVYIKPLQGDVKQVLDNPNVTMSSRLRTRFKRASSQPFNGKDGVITIPINSPQTIVALFENFSPKKVEFFLPDYLLYAAALIRNQLSGGD